MHALQEELLAAFRAWDGARMARAAASMVELVLERTLTAAELEELTWAFREHLASVAGADATVEYEDSSPRFVELLRRAGTLAGFPGYAGLPVEKRPAFLRELTDGVPLP